MDDGILHQILSISRRKLIILLEHIEVKWLHTKSHTVKLLELLAFKAKSVATFLAILFRNLYGKQFVQFQSIQATYFFFHFK